MYEQAETSWNWFYFNDIQLWQLREKNFERNSLYVVFFSQCHARVQFQPKKNSGEHLHIGNI